MKELVFAALNKRVHYEEALEVIEPPITPRDLDLLIGGLSCMEGEATSSEPVEEYAALRYRLEGIRACMGMGTQPS